MTAVVYSGYGPPDVLKIAEIEKPSPKEDEVLIKVRAASLNPLDWRLMRGRPYLLRLLIGLRKPKERPGRDVAGQVVAIGSKVTRFRIGDDVFGTCAGALSEYARASEAKLAIKPAIISFEEAAAIPIAGLTALQGLRDRGHIHSGQEVLINGAAGGVGTFAVQIAKSFGAIVTGVCSARNAEMVHSIGADRVVDYTNDDFTKCTQRYDLILDNVGNRSLSAYRHVLKPKGRLIIVGGPKIGAILIRALQARLLSWFVSQDLRFFGAQINQQDLNTIADLMQAGKVRSVIDRRYTLNEVPEAFGYLEEGHARGKVVITVSS